MEQMQDYDIVLVSMPVNAIDGPSSALGLLKAEAARGNISSHVVYSNLRFVEFLGFDNYAAAEKSIAFFTMGWEILFAQAAGFTPFVSVADFIAAGEKELAVYFRQQGKNLDAQEVAARFEKHFAWIKSRISDFIDAEARYILSFSPKIVGCSILTQQRNASFALLKRIKTLAPDVTTLIGGGICVGDTAHAFINAVPEIDYVFTGEGDSVFADGCRYIIEQRFSDLHKRLPCFFHRGGNMQICATQDLNTMAVPDYSDYFKQLSTMNYRDKISPINYIEGSRGCWWGEKHRCGFCGMHYSVESLKYRSKTPERIYRELDALIKSTKCHTVIFTDCILSRDFIASLPDLSDTVARNAKAPNEFPPRYLFAETKSNLSESDVRRLRLAGFTSIQPGIEAINDNLLLLMNKGNRAIKHIELLKFARRYGLGIAWNLLHTFPGNENHSQWYKDTIALSKLIHHFEPPHGAMQVVLMRCSVFQEQAERYGLKTIAPQYFNYAADPCDMSFTNATAFLLASPDIYINTDTISSLNLAVKEWTEAFEANASLTMKVSEHETLLFDTRSIRTADLFKLTDVQKAVFDRAYNVVSLSKLQAELSPQYNAASINDAVDFLDANHVIVHIKDEILALALPENTWQYCSRGMSEAAKAGVDDE